MINNNKIYIYSLLALFFLSIVILFSVLFLKDEVNKINKGTEFQFSNNKELSEATIDSVSEFYPEIENPPLMIVEPMGYHGDEISPEWQNKKWVGIFKEGNRLYIDSVRINISSCYDPILDDSEQDSLSWTGLLVSALSKDTCLYLINGLPFLQKRYLTNVIDSVAYLYPSDPVKGSFLDSKYTLYATAKTTPSDYSPDEVFYTNYRLFLKEKTYNKEVEQLLAATPYFDDYIFNLLFVGDIDNDGFPDFIINTSHHYNLRQPTLYLSSYADEGELVKAVATHASVGC